MINGRVVAWLLGGLILVGLVVGLVKVWLPPGPRRIAEDSYSGAASGYRALVELLQSFDVDVQRNADVPSAMFEGDRRVVLLEPDLYRIEREKDYLARMETWVDGGGQLVVVAKTFQRHHDHDRPHEDELLGKDEFLTRLGLEGLQMSALPEPDHDEDMPPLIPRREPLVPKDAPYAVRATGSLSGPASAVSEVFCKAEVPGYFGGDAVAKAEGRIEVATGNDTWALLALEYTRGAGKVLLVADPTPFHNLGISHGDNAVLAYWLAVGDGTRPVVVDEFYHGMAPEGNWLALVGTYPYGLVALFTLAAALCWVWSNVIRFGPPAETPPPSRRSIGEYIEAMACLFQKGKKGAFVLKTCRDGFLDEIRAELCLDSGTPRETVLRQIRQFDRPRAARLEEVLSAVDAALADTHTLTSTQLLGFQERLESCRNSRNLKPFQNQRGVSRHSFIAR